MGRNDSNGKSRAWLDRLAESIADGTPVDWEHHQRTHPELAKKLALLRDFEAVAQVCHSRDAVKTTGSLREPQNPAQDDNSESRQNLVPQFSTWGHLAFLEKIGEGAYGEVYRAYDSSLDLEVALKLLRPDHFSGRQAPERLLKEARCLAQVHHPNVITVHGADIHDGLVGIWTELLHGKTLEECLDCSGSFSADEAALVGIELCGALAAIHAAGLVHGDIKPTNVMRQEGGRIVLMDFGTARKEAPDLSDESGGQGTPLAMAPELLLDAGPPTRASDIYSLGVLLYRLVARDYPVQAHGLKELTDKHKRGETTPLRDRRPDLPPAFLQVVNKALAAQPEERFATFGDMEKALRAAVCVQPAPAPPPSRWRRLGGAATGMVALAAVVWAILHFLPEPRLRVQTQFYKHQASSIQELLDANSNLKLQAGDSLFLTLESREDAYLYVFNESTQDPGVVFTLFPSRRALTTNPVVGGVRHRLPDAAYWEFDGKSSEILLIVASREPRLDLESRIAQEFHDAEEEAVAGTDAAETAPLEGAGDQLALELDPEKLVALNLRRLQVRPQSNRNSTLEAMAGVIRDEMMGSKDLWYQIVRIEP
ncbi:MAG: protein kinase [Candidatus Latescibacterota bacterium]|nr:MAG: protein kinase [Candidatus Latescibacterota bacterium]